MASLLGIFRRVEDRSIIPERLNTMYKEADVPDHEDYLRYACSNDCSVADKNGTSHLCPVCGTLGYKDREPKLRRFYYVPLLYQLLHRLRNDVEFAKLVYSKERDKNDIWDGEFIQDLMKKHPELTDEEYIHLSFGNDAVLAYGKVGPNHSVTALMVKIYNIHPIYRTKDENLFLVGLIFGPGLPTSLDIYAKMFFDEIVRSNAIGKVIRSLECFPIYLEIYCNPAHDELRRRLRLNLLSCEGDHPAMTKLMNTMSSGSVYACFKCLLKGEHPKTTTQAGMIYPHYLNGQNQRAHRRTHQSLLNAAIEVAKPGGRASDYGVNGPSILSTCLPSFNLVEQNLFDLFHALYENTASDLVKLVKFNSQQRQDQKTKATDDCVIHIGIAKKQRDLISHRLAKIQICHDFGKKPKDFMEKSLKGICRSHRQSKPPL